MICADEVRLIEAHDKHARAICALIEAAGMHWENQHRIRNGYAPAYGDAQFLDLLTHYGLEDLKQPDRHPPTTEEITDDDR